MRKNKTFQNRTFFSAMQKGRFVRFFSLSVLFFLLFSVGAYSQQVIGSYPVMDGGFEAQTTGALSGTGNSIATNTACTVWTKATSSFGTATINTNTPRSGGKYINCTYPSMTSGTGNHRRLISPTTTSGAVPVGSYRFQFYYRLAGAATNGAVRGGASSDGTTGVVYGTAAAVTSTNWTKYSGTANVTTAAALGAGIIDGYVSSGAGSTSVSFDYDDFVMYAGSADDTTAPNSAGTVTVAANATNPTSSLDVSWGAASGGVDGGGYMVLRFASTSPNADQDPNVNGIYAVGNTITNGTGGVANPGTVVYVGTGTNFTDASLQSGTTYYYKVYTVDKAFNYAAETTGSGATDSAPATPLTTPTLGSTVKLASETGFTAYWTAVANAVSYDVKVYNSSNVQVGSTQNASGQATSSLAISMTLTAGVTYKFTVTAKGDVVHTLDSPESGYSTDFTIYSGKVLSQYTASEGTLQANLTAGTVDVYDLVTSGGAYIITGTNATPCAITKSTTIIGHSGLAARPIISVSNSSTSSTSAILCPNAANMTFTLSNIEATGVNANGAGSVPLFVYGQSASTNLQLVINNCYIHDFLNTMGNGVVRLDASTGTGIDIENTLFNNCNGRMIHFYLTDAALTYGNVVLKNCTFNNTTTTATGTNANANSVLFFRTASGINAKYTNLTVDHCSFIHFNSVTIGTSTPQDIFKLSGGTGTASITNCIFDDIQYGNINNTSSPVLSVDNNYLAGIAAGVPTSSTYKTVTNTLAAVAPTYTNAASLNFTLTNKSSLICADGYVAGNTFGATLSALSAPSTISNASSVGTTSFTAGWSSVTNATGYIVNVYDATPTLVSTTRVGAVLTTPVSGLTANTNYTYKVIAIGDATTYKSSAESSASNSFKTKSTPTLSISNSPQTYNGSAQAATVNGSVAGTVSNVLYTGSATVPTNAGSYAITADFMPDDVANYVSVTGGSAGTFVISQATPTLSLASSSVSYNGSAQAATVNSSVSGTVSNVKYDGSATAPTAVGSYAVTADFAPTDATNYSSLTGASAGSFTISAPPSVNVVADANLSSYSTTSTTDVTVTSGELTIDADASVKTMTVKAGGKLTLAAGKTLTVAGAFTLQSDATGTGTFVDNGGTISAASTNVEQYLATGRNWYVSSPVSGATAAVFNPAGLSNLLYSYDEVHGSSSSLAWPAITSNATSLTVMKGYVANMASSGVVTFTGSLNTGAQEIGVTRTQSQTKAGFNLVGNPYPSYLDWSNVTKTNLLTTMWYRTKTSGDVYTFDTYNATGNLATSNGAKAVTNMIPPMQAFWVRVDGSPVTGTLSVSNAQRAHADNSSNTFKAKATIETQPVIRLQVSNGVNSDQALIYYNADATNGFDSYDSPKLSNESASIPEIYTLAGSEQLVINGVNDATELALGFTTGQANNFTIKASQFANFAAGTQIILRDNMLNYEQDLTLADYNFYSDVTANNETRFTLLVKAPSVATGINANSNNNVWVSLNGNNQIVVNGATGETSVAVYNEVGQRILSQRLTASTKALGNFVPGVYLVTVTNAGKSATQKVIIK